MLPQKKNHPKEYDFLIIFLPYFFRYDNISDNLEKSERERLFDEHIDNLVAKKKENYRKLLDEQKGIALDSNFKDIKKLIRDDPRYSRYVCFQIS